MPWKWNSARRSDSAGPDSEPEERSPGPSLSPDPGPEDPHSEDSQSQPLETVGLLLRTMGQYAFDLQSEDAGDIRDRFDRWQRHLLMGMSRPDAVPARELCPIERRDWAGVRQYFTQHRRAEHLYVTGSLDDMRRMVWALINSLNRAVARDKSADAGVVEELRQLEIIAQSRSIEEIKRGVLIAVSRIGAVIEERNRQQEECIRHLGEKLEALDNQLKEARAESSLDALTRLHNRRAFDDYVAQTIELNSLFDYPACLLIIDVDHFKAVNDRFGHPAGDAVLKALAHRLSRTFMMKGDLVARYGGEEFAVVLRQTRREEGRLLCERLMADVRALRIHHAGANHEVTVSVGFAPLQAGDTEHTWLGRADAALYEAKRSGRDRVVEACAPAKAA